MLKRGFIIAVTLSLLGCGVPSIPQEVAPVMGFVQDDLGGVVWDRAQIISNMNKEQHPLAIRGVACASACLMYLALNDVCVDRGVTFYMHGLVDLTKGRAPPDEATVNLVTQVYLKHLPQGMRERWSSEVKGRPLKYHKITAQEAVSRGWVKYCSPLSK